MGVVQSHGGTIDALNDTINDSFVSDPDLVVNWGLVVGGVGSCLLLVRQISEDGVQVGPEFFWCHLLVIRSFTCAGVLLCRWWSGYLGCML